MERQVFGKCMSQSGECTTDCLRYFCCQLTSVAEIRYVELFWEKAENGDNKREHGIHILLNDGRVNIRH